MRAQVVALTLGQWASPSTYIVTFTSGRAQDVQLSASNLQSAKVLQQACQLILG